MINCASPFFIGFLFMAFYWAFMGTKCQVYLRSFIIINFPTTHCQTTLNTMVINFVLIIAPSSALPPSNYVLTTRLVTSSIPPYQPLPLWIVSFITITPPLSTIVDLPIIHALLFHGPNTTPNNFHQYHNFPTCSSFTITTSALLGDYSSKPHSSYHPFPLDLGLGFPFGCAQNISPRFSSTTNRIFAFLQCYISSNNLALFIGQVDSRPHGCCSVVFFLVILLMVSHITSPRGSKTTQGNFSTTTLLLIGGLKNLIKWTFILHSSYGIKIPLSTIHSSWLSTPQMPPTKFHFGLCTQIFKCNVGPCPLFFNF